MRSSLLLMGKGFVILLLVLVLCEFVVGGTSSEIETSFVVMLQEDVDVDVDSGFWNMYGNYVSVGVVVLIVAVLYAKSLHSRK